MRNLIRIVEAANKGCPVATYDIDINLKNRQRAIDDYHYGPANPNEPGDYWKSAAERWNITEKTAKTMQCGNCAAFDTSKETMSCIAKGIAGEDKGEHPYDTIKAGTLGYCNFLDFKCAAKRTCKAWVTKD